MCFDSRHQSEGGRCGWGWRRIFCGTCQAWRNFSSVSFLCKSMGGSSHHCFRYRATNTFNVKQTKMTTKGYGIDIHTIEKLITKPDSEIILSRKEFELRKLALVDGEDYSLKVSDRDSTIYTED